MTWLTLQRFRRGFHSDETFLLRQRFRLCKIVWRRRDKESDWQKIFFLVPHLFCHCSKSCACVKKSRFKGVHGRNIVCLPLMSSGGKVQPCNKQIISSKLVYVVLTWYNRHVMAKAVAETKNRYFLPWTLHSFSRHFSPPISFAQVEILPHPTCSSYLITRILESHTARQPWRTDPRVLRLATTPWTQTSCRHITVRSTVWPLMRW